MTPAVAAPPPQKIVLPATAPWYVEPELVQDWTRWKRQLEHGDDKGLLDLTMRLIRACPAFLLHNYTQIQDKDFNLVPFANWHDPQKRLYRTVRNLQRLNRPVRVIIDKPRQTGISTAIEGICYHTTGFLPNTTSIIAAQEDDACTRIYEMFRVFFATTPEVLRPHTERFTTDEIRFGDRKSDPGNLGLASRILMKTAALGSIKKNESGKGRGATYRFGHFSEVAYFTVPDRFISGIEDGIPDRPGTFLFLESTANGQGNWFHRRWQKAAEGWRMVKGDDGRPKWTNVDRRPSLWIPFFVSVLEQAEYQMRLPGDGTDKERAYYAKHLDKDERRLVDEYGASLEAIEWRRYQIDKKNGDLLAYQREYPVTPEESFATSGSKIFDIRAIAAYQDETYVGEKETPPARGSLIRSQGKFWISEDPRGSLKVWKQPAPGRLYVIGADPCEGRGTEGDNASAQVLCASSPDPRENWEQVATFYERIDPDEFTQILLALGHWYGEAFIVLEVMGGGQTTANELTKAGYWNRYRRREWDNIGNQYVLKWDWKSNTKSRTMLVGALRKHVRLRDLKLHDPETVAEMAAWTKLETARGGFKEGPPDSTGHDDRLVALGLAVQGGLLDNPLDDDESLDRESPGPDPTEPEDDDVPNPLPQKGRLREKNEERDSTYYD